MVEISESGRSMFKRWLSAVAAALLAVVTLVTPAAGSPGCSKEAADFQDRIAEFAAVGYQVIGISPDKPAKLKDFEDAQQLTFPLLSDPDYVAHKAFGAYGTKSLYGRTYEGVLRSTTIVDENYNVVQSFYNVKATGHVDQLLKIIS